MARSRNRRRNRGRGGPRRRSAPGGRQPQVFIVQQRGTIAQSLSLGASVTSLFGDKRPTFTVYPIRAVITIASEKKCFYQIQQFSAFIPNDVISVVNGLVCAGSRTHRFRWPRSALVGITEKEQSQNLLEMDHPCINMTDVSDTAYYYHIKFWFRSPYSAVPDTCPSVSALRPKDLPDATSPASSYEMT